MEKLSGKMWLVLVAAAALAISPATASNPVANLNDLSGDFLLDCLRNPWIEPCREEEEKGSRFLALVDQQGKFLQELVRKEENTTLAFVAARSTHLTRPDRGTVLEKGYPNFLFRLTPCALETGAFYLQTAAGRLVSLLPSGDGVELVRDSCTETASREAIEHTDVTNSATTSSVLETEEPSTLAECSWEQGKDCQGQEGEEEGKDVCYLAKWTLSRVGPDGIFLNIRSHFQSTIGLRMNRGSLGASTDQAELFTGIKTAFVESISLSQPPSSSTSLARRGSLERANDTVQGDVIVHFVDRIGNKGQGYVCDYRWDLRAARTACQELGFQDGFPTHDSHFSFGTDVDGPYAVSGVECGYQARSIRDCRFKVTRSADSQMVAQRRSVSPFGGSGYACGPRDRAGVVCGSSNSIANSVAREATETCSDEDEDNHVATAAASFSLRSQVSKVAAQINGKNHWSQYVLPIPSTVSLLTSVVLQSGQFDRTIMLSPPKGGFNLLRWETYQPNLLEFVFSATDAFKKSYLNMNDIKHNSQDIHKFLGKAIQNAFSPDPREHKTLLTFHLDEVSRAANNSYIKAKEIVQAYETTGAILEELIAAVVATERDRGRSVDLLEEELTILKASNERMEKAAEEQEKELKEKKRKVDESLEEFHNAAKKAMQEECYNGNTVCNDCVFQEERKYDECVVERVQMCAEYDVICLERAKSGWSFGIPGVISIGRESISDECIKEELVCNKHEMVCPQHRYERAGRYCKAKPGALCGPCTFSRDIGRTVAEVVRHAARMRNAMGQDAATAYPSLLQQIGLVLKPLRKLTGDVRHWKESSKDGAETINDRLEINGFAEADNRISGFDNSTALTHGMDDQNEGEEKWYAFEQNGTDTAEAKDMNIWKRLILLKRQVGLLEQLTNTIENGDLKSEVQEWLMGLSAVLQELETQEVEFASGVGNEQFDFLTESMQRGAELAEAVAVKVRETSSSSFDRGFGSLSPQIAAETRAVVANANAHGEAARELGLVQRALMEGVEEVLGKDVRLMNLQQVVAFLRQAAQQLNFLKSLWSRLSLFFHRTAHLLGHSQDNLRQAVRYYRLMQLDRSLVSDPVQSFTRDVQESCVLAMAYNVYTNRLATFYVSLTEDGGLLESLNGIGANLREVEDPLALDRYKRFLRRDANAALESIGRAVEEEERLVADKLFRSVQDMRRTLACKWKQNEERLAVASDLSRESREALETERADLAAGIKAVDAEINSGMNEANSKSEGDADVASTSRQDISVIPYAGGEDQVEMSWEIDEIFE